MMAQIHTRRILIATIVGLTILFASGTFSTRTAAQSGSSSLAAAAAAKPTPLPVTTREFTVNGHRIAVSCSGTGTPTVILDGYLPGADTTWVSVRPEIAAFTRVCTIVRLDGGFRKLTTQMIAQEGAGIFKRADFTGNFVYVAWGFGGYSARQIATQMPGRIAGMVLIDTNHEDYFTRFRPLLPTLPKNREGDQPQLQTELRAMARDVFDLEQSAALVKASRTSLGQMPLIVLARGQADLPASLSAQKQQELYGLWMEQQSDLATLSSNSRLVVAETSGHNIPQNQPALVVDAIRQVVDAARTKQPLAR